MTEVYLGAKFLVEKVFIHHEFVDLFGQLTMGTVSVGMKAELNGKTIEIIDVLVSGTHGNPILTVKGITVDEITPNQTLTFAPSFVK